ncbi:MAG TPA: type II toxin-antitoxin system PemK/MazF family toxin [Lamprocystis sp. (in: g-proteobacteria)]|nr:type II toxin-antitoxin system PemK/MazF family toxin [Lamprocystis sp. (in: g-proteobacteria)]
MPMQRPLPIFEPGDLVKVPFPYPNRPTRQSRPALVVADGNGGDTLGLLWVVMVTSVENRGWPGDILLADLTGTGLPAPSLVRTAKIATIEARDRGPRCRAARQGRVWRARPGHGADCRPPWRVGVMRPVRPGPTRQLVEPAQPSLTVWRGHAVGLARGARFAFKT